MMKIIWECHSCGESGDGPTGPNNRCPNCGGSRIHFSEGRGHDMATNPKWSGHSDEQLRRFLSLNKLAVVILAGIATWALFLASAPWLLVVIGIGYFFVVRSGISIERELKARRS